MSNTAISSLIQSGTKLFLDSIDPELVARNRAMGATGATSNPIIVSELLKTGRFDREIDGFMQQGLDDSQIAWRMTDKLVRDAQAVFRALYAAGVDGVFSDFPAMAVAARG